MMHACAFDRFRSLFDPSVHALYMGVWGDSLQITSQTTLMVAMSAFLRCGPSDFLRGVSWNAELADTLATTFLVSSTADCGVVTLAARVSASFSIILIIFMSSCFSV